MRVVKWFISAAASLAFAATIALAGEEGHIQGVEKTLYVWAGDQAHKAPDFLAVIEFDEETAGNPGVG